MVRGDDERVGTRGDSLTRCGGRGILTSPAALDNGRGALHCGTLGAKATVKETARTRVTKSREDKSYVWPCEYPAGARPPGERAGAAAGPRDHVFFFSSRRRHTRCSRDWSSDVCSSD